PGLKEEMRMRTIHTTSLALLLALTACQKGGGAGETDSDTGETSGETGGACPGDLEFFEARVWAPILGKTCITCHSPEGLAKDSQMVLVAEGEDGWLEANFAAVKAVAQVEVGGESLLLLKPTNRHPEMHKGGMVVAPDTEAYDAL